MPGEEQYSDSSGDDLDLHDLNRHTYETFMYNGASFRVHRLVYIAVLSDRASLMEEAAALSLDVDHIGILAMALAQDARAILEYLLSRRFYRRILALSNNG